jgi:hypothetical protein
MFVQGRVGYRSLDISNHVLTDHQMKNPAPSRAGSQTRVSSPGNGKYENPQLKLYLIPIKFRGL